MVMKIRAETKLTDCYLPKIIKLKQVPKLYYVTIALKIIPLFSINTFQTIKI